MINEFTTYLGSIKGYSQKTCQAYGNDLRKFAVWMKNYRDDARWSTITREDLDAYIMWNVETGMKPATTNRYLASISSLYDYLKRQGRMDTNPARYESRRKIEQTIPNTIPMDVLKTAYKKSAGTIHIMLGVLMTTGVRVQELLDITKADLDVMNNIIRINGKGAKQRMVYTTKDIMKQLQNYAVSRTNQEPIFQGWEQRAVRRAVWEILSPICDARQLSPHAIRHTFATQIAKGGGNVTTLAVMMGHNSIKTTQKYIDLGQQEVEGAFKTYQQHIS